MAMAPPYPARRPLGVSILAVLVGIYGVVLILGGLLLLVGSVALSALGFGPHFLGLVGVLAGAVVLIVGLIILGVALGLWHLRLWALVLALIVTFVELLGYAVGGNFVSFGFIFSLIIFVYLIAVHRHFH